MACDITLDSELIRGCRNHVAKTDEAEQRRDFHFVMSLQQRPTDLCSSRLSPSPLSASLYLLAPAVLALEF